MAERGGFEPPEAFTSTVFKTVAFVRSAISPSTKLAAALGATPQRAIMPADRSTSDPFNPVIDNIATTAAATSS